MQHFITITKAQFEALAKLTSGDPALQTELTRSLVKALNLAQLGNKGRYHIAVTTPDLGTIRYILTVHSLKGFNGPLNRFMREYGDLIEG